MRTPRTLVHRVLHRPPPTPVVAAALPKSTRRFEVDVAFQELLADAVLQAEGGAAPVQVAPARQRKLFNLVQALRYCREVPGVVAECGTYRGTSARVLCGALCAERAGFRGEGVHLFDSFAGLSALADADSADPAVEGRTPRHEGMFAATPEHVRTVLAEFPDVTLHIGWIPHCFADAPDAPYRFVHLDVDLYEPTLAGLEHFVPGMGPGGVLVIDDYGAVRWPGVAQAVDEYCAPRDLRVLELDSGQALLFA